MAQSSERTYYLAHPAVGVLEVGDRWPLARSDARLGSAWDELDESTQEELEEAFFSALLDSVKATWPGAMYRVEYPYGDSPRLLSELAGGSFPRRGVVEGALNGRAIRIIVESAPQPVLMEIDAESEVRLYGEPWQGVGLLLTRSEVTEIRAAVVGHTCPES